MDLASLQVFQTVVREKSFSRAAEKLFRTQPAISISIRKLEEWVGQPLFVRGSGARTLTDAGALLLEYADRMLNLREEIRKSMKELRGIERGQVSLGVNESSIHALLPALARYRELHPGIHIRVHRVFSRDVPREVLSHHLDIGVISYIPEETELSAKEFYRDNLTVVVWPGHRLAKRRAVDITDLGEETFVGSHRRIPAPPARRSAICAPPCSAPHGYRDAHYRKHQIIRRDEEGYRHRAQDVRGPGDSSRNAAGTIACGKCEFSGAFISFTARTGPSPPRLRRCSIS